MLCLQQPAVSDAVRRLTDTSQYTGSHKERFDKDGRGRGKEGRTDSVANDGYVQGYKQKSSQDKGNPTGKKWSRYKQTTTNEKKLIEKKNPSLYFPKYKTYNKNVHLFLFDCMERYNNIELYFIQINKRTLSYAFDSPLLNCYPVTI